MKKVIKKVSRYYSKKEKYAMMFCLIIVMLLIPAIKPSTPKVTRTQIKNSESALNTEDKIKVELVRTVDGDTAVFNIDGEDTTFRFLSINTPELEEDGGKEAKEYVDKMLKNSRNISIEYDTEAQTDKYGRSLGWIWIDDNLLQLDLIEKGFAKVAYLYGNYKYNDILINAEKESGK